MATARAPARAEEAPRRLAPPLNERAAAPGRQSLAEAVAPSVSRAVLSRPRHSSRSTRCEDLLYIKSARCLSVLELRSQRAPLHSQVDPARRQVPVDSRPAAGPLFPRSHDGRSAGHRLCHLEDSRRHQDRRPWPDSSRSCEMVGPSTRCPDRRQEKAGRQPSRPKRLLVAVYHHVPVAKAHQKYTGFHVALPARTAAGERVPLQPGGYWVSENAYPTDLEGLVCVFCLCGKSMTLRN